MAPTEGRVARVERRWGCRRGTPVKLDKMLLSKCSSSMSAHAFGHRVMPYEVTLTDNVLTQ